MIRTLLAICAFAALNASAEPIEHAMTCVAGELKIDFVVQHDVDTTISATSPYDTVKVLGCAFTKVSKDEQIVPHCAATKGIIRYDIYPEVAADFTVAGATVIAWTSADQVLDHVPLSCSTTK